MMPVQQDGMNVDPHVLIRTQENFIAQARVKEVRMEAAIQQLLDENQRLQTTMDAMVEAAEGGGEPNPEAEQE